MEHFRRKFFRHQCFAAFFGLCAFALGCIAWRAGDHILAAIDGIIAAANLGIFLWAGRIRRNLPHLPSDLDWP